MPIASGHRRRLADLLLTDSNFFAPGQTDRLLINYMEAAKKDEGATNIAQLYCAESHLPTGCGFVQGDSES